MCFYKAKFSVENGKQYEGYTKGDNMNGWALPLFTKDIAEEFLSDAKDEEMNIQYDKDSDSFIVEFERYDEPVVCKAIEITVNAETIKVYEISALGCCWEED